MAVSQSNIGNEEQSFSQYDPIKSELHTIVDKLQLDEPPSEQQGRPLWQRVLSWAVPLWLVAFFVVWCYNARVDTCGGAKAKYRGNVLCIASERDYLLLNETYETEFLARDTSEPMPIDSLNQKKYDDLTETIKSKYADTTAQDVDTRTRLTFLNALRGNGLDSASYCRNLAMGYYNVAVNYLNKGNRDSACIAYRFLKGWHWKDSVLTKGELAVLEQICLPPNPKQQQTQVLPQKNVEKPQVQQKLPPQTPPQYKEPILPTAKVPDLNIGNLQTKRLENIENATRNAQTGVDNDPKAPQRITPVESVTTKVGNVSFDMVKVAGGTFKMGSEDKEAGDDEKPVHSVTLSDFYIGKYEVTVGQYLQFCTETNANFPEWLEKGNEYNVETGKNDAYKKLGYQRKGSETLPIVGVSYNNAIAFCQWLSEKSKKSYRLPTEAEWEFAAKGGNASKELKYSGSDNIDEVAWYDSNSGNKTHPVGTKKANELGIYDMTGNVLEWCSDWYDSYKDSYRNSIQNNPTGADKGSLRVIRGGGWLTSAQDCRVSFRNYYAPSYRFNDVGFRVVLSP